MTGLQITIDCLDPSVLVPFWCLALDYAPTPPPDGFTTWRAWYVSIGVPDEEFGDSDGADRIHDPEGVRPAIWFQVVPEPKTVKNRVHLDVVLGRHLPMAERREVVDRRAELLEAHGATRVAVHQAHAHHYGITLQDPEGNELCIT
jgi:hypothetical protein